MSKFIILLLVIYSAISPAYAQATHSEADKAAIVAVIEQETRCYSNNYYDGWQTKTECVRAYESGMQGV